MPEDELVGRIPSEFEGARGESGELRYPGKPEDSIRGGPDAGGALVDEPAPEKGGVMMLTAEEYRKAEFGYTLAESRRGFVIHAIVYGVVMTGLSVLNAMLWVYADANFPWAVFPLIGWGIGLMFHYIYGFRRAADEARARQHSVEEYAERAKELV